MPSELELWVYAQQWRELADFAGHIDRPRLDAAGEAARYLRYFAGLSKPEWAEVERFTANHSEEVEALRRRTEADTELYYQSSGIAQRWRLLFAFGAQFTIRAGALATDYLRERHEMSAGEWQHVEAFLEGQEEMWGDGTERD